MANGQGNSETPMSKWSRVFGQMFSERHPEDFLKHLDGYNVPTTSSMGSERQFWTDDRVQTVNGFAEHLVRMRFIRMANESEASNQTVSKLFNGIHGIGLVQILKSSDFDYF